MVIYFSQVHRLIFYQLCKKIVCENRRGGDDSVSIELREYVAGRLNFKISIYGEKGALHWAQENPNYARLSAHGELDQVITRAGPIHKDSSMANVRIPPGHPEGYLEGFAQIYTDAADVIQGSNKASQLLDILPNIEDGLHIMKFINAAVESSNNNAKWMDIN